MPTHHHRIPADLSSIHEPVYLGLNVPQSLGLALAAFLTLWSFTWSLEFVRSLFLIAVWSCFITLGFWEIEGYPASVLLVWAWRWFVRRIRPRSRRRGPAPLFRM